MQKRIERCYGEFNPFVKFPLGHAPVARASVQAGINKLLRLVYEPGPRVRYPTGRLRIAGAPTVYEVKMLFYLQALSVRPRAKPRYVKEWNDHHMLVSREAEVQWPRNPYAKLCNDEGDAELSESDEEAKTTESDGENVGDEKTTESDSSEDAAPVANNDAAPVANNPANDIVENTTESDAPIDYVSETDWEW